MGTALPSLGLSGGPLASHWGTLANLGTHFGHRRLHWGVLELPWDCFGDDFGLFWASSEKNCPWEPHRKPMALKYRACAQKQASWNLPAGPAGPGGPVQIRRNGPQTTVQTLRSTRAGGHHDVSFTNSLNLKIDFQIFPGSGMINSKSWSM